MQARNLLGKTEGALCSASIIMMLAAQLSKVKREQGNENKTPGQLLYGFLAFFGEGGGFDAETSSITPWVIFCFPKDECNLSSTHESLNVCQNRQHFLKKQMPALPPHVTNMAFPAEIFLAR